METNTKTGAFARRKRMVVLPKRIDDKLLRQARHHGHGISAMIREYIVEGLKRDGLLESR